VPVKLMGDGGATMQVDLRERSMTVELTPELVCGLRCGCEEGTTKRSGASVERENGWPLLVGETATEPVTGMEGGL
jgi:hypothetical protein